jgi:AraC-like DNA-binding protein
MRVLPDASAYVIFDFAGELSGSAYLVGTLLRPVLVNLNGEVNRVGIRIRPGMANLLFNVSAKNLRDRVLGLDDAGIQLPGSLLDELMNVPDLHSRVHAIERWLLGRLSELEPSVLATQTETARLFHAITRGACPRAIAGLMAWNERKAQRVFKERFGASAATLRRWGRFRRCLAILEARTHLSRAMISAHLGYSDQAHMCREFREFSGTDIASLLSERQSVGNVQAAGQQSI